MWRSIKDFFRDSETIFWARLQAVLGVAAVVMTYVDPALFVRVFPSGWEPWVLLANGIATEYLRRRREPGM